MKVQFGDLPQDAQQMLTSHLRVDFTHCDFKAPRWFSAWARNESGNITGIFAIEFPFWFEGRVTVLVLDPRCMSRRVLRAIFTAAFTHARRLTAEVEPDNRRALRQVQRMGFQLEGVRRCGLEGTRDTIVFGMLKNECRYLPSYVPPSEPPLDIAYRHLPDAVVRSYSGLRTGISTDREHLIFGEFGVGPSFTPPGSPFDEVSASGPPAEMVAIDAVPYSAGMRGVHSARRRPVRGDAYDAMDFPAGAVMSHLRVASMVNGERPKQALVSNIGDSMIEKTFRGHLSSLTKV